MFLLRAFLHQANSKGESFLLASRGTLEQRLFTNMDDNSLINDLLALLEERQRDKNPQFCAGVMSSGFSIFYPFFYGLYSVGLK